MKKDIMRQFRIYLVMRGVSRTYPSYAVRIGLGAGGPLLLFGLGLLPSRKTGIVFGNCVSQYMKSCQ